MTGSNDSLKIDILYNFIRHKLFELYLVQKYHIFRIENEKISVTKPVIYDKPFDVTAI